jgi:hypothetical protein
MSVCNRPRGEGLLSVWLIADEYRSGVIRWDASIVEDYRVTIDGAPVAILPTDTGEPNILYSLLSSDVRERGEFRFDVDLKVDNVDFAWLEWVRVDGNVEVRMWSVNRGRVSESRLLHIKRFGSHIRLVLDASRVEWDQDYVFRVGDDSVRFISDRISGTATGTPDFNEKTGNASVRFRLGPRTHVGRTIEVVAAAKGNVDARTRAGAVFGLIGLVFGPAALGTVLFEAEIEADRNGIFQETVVNQLEWPYVLEVPDVAKLERALNFGQVVMRSDKGTMRALDRYREGLAAEYPELKLAAFFSGIEVIVRQFEHARGGVPSVSERAVRHKKAFQRFLNLVGDSALKSKIMGSLGHSSITDAFEFWKQQHSFATPESNQFRDMVAIRNSLFHSGSAKEMHDIVVATGRLLADMIARTAGFSPNERWSRLPPFQITAPVQYERYGDGKSGDNDIEPPHDHYW